MRKTKLICTIGPACEDEQILEEMCLAGMNVARLNFSHGTHEEHGKKIELIKKVREKLNLPIPIMLDTKGPEYRIRTFRNGKVFLHDGDDFTFTTEDIIGDEHIVSVNFKQLMENLEIGDTILVNNGLVIFKVVGLSSSRAKCKVIVGGELSNSKSMNFPNRVMKHEFLSEQDKEDLLFGIENQVDFANTRNVIVAALILVLSIGIKYGMPGEAITIQAGEITIGLTGLAVASLVGIILNAILPDGDVKFAEEPKDAGSLGKY